MSVALRKPPKSWAIEFERTLALLRRLSDAERDNMGEIGIAVVALRGFARDYVEARPRAEARTAWLLEHAAIHYAQQLAEDRRQAKP